jgi:hypothetical protein
MGTWGFTVFRGQISGFPRAARKRFLGAAVLEFFAGSRRGPERWRRRARQETGELDHGASGVVS